MATIKGIDYIRTCGNTPIRLGLSFGFISLPFKDGAGSSSILRVDSFNIDNDLVFFLLNVVALPLHLRPPPAATEYPTCYMGGG